MALVLGKKLIQTTSTDFLAVLNHLEAGVSTNVFLRILHNRAVDLAWIVQPVIFKKAWPKISRVSCRSHFSRRGETQDEAEAAIEAARQRLLQARWTLRLSICVEITILFIPLSRHHCSLRVINCP
jgi:hypothetical protein